MRDKFYFNCDCDHNSHHFILELFPKDRDAYISIYLYNTWNFITRLKIAFSYLFGITYPYGCYDDILLNETKLRELKNILEEFLDGNSI